MACNSCHNHSGGMFDENFLRHNSIGEFHDENLEHQQGEHKSKAIWILAGVFILGTLFIGKKLK